MHQKNQFRQFLDNSVENWIVHLSINSEIREHHFQ
jgi:hypothetical protein